MSKTFKYSINEIALSLIESGMKKVEGRLFKNTFTKIKKGDTIIFFNKDRNIKVSVFNIKKYNSFSDMLINEGICRTTPLSDSLKNSLSIYRKYYSYEDELTYGVLAITIKL